MFHHSTNPTSFFSILIAVLIFSLSLAGVAGAGDSIVIGLPIPAPSIANTSLGDGALLNNDTGQSNTAIGYHALLGNESGNYNTAIGAVSLWANNRAAKTPPAESMRFSAILQATATLPPGTKHF